MLGELPDGGGDCDQQKANEKQMRKTLIQLAELRHFLQE